MSVFRPFFSTPFPSNDLNNLLNLLDQPIHHPQSLRRALAKSENTGGAVGTFSPRFDIKETKTGYELHGELPGIEQKDINIEWSEGNTLTVHGRTEYTRTEGSQPTPVEEGYESLETPESESSHYHKATVEDAAEQGETSTPANAESENKEVAKSSGAGEVAKETPKAKYWIQERSVGEFHRSFSFPVPVDQDNVKASLKNGILSVTVPKAERPKVRRIQVE